MATFSALKLDPQGILFSKWDQKLFKVVFHQIFACLSMFRAMKKQKKIATG